MRSHAGVAGQMFKTLADESINIQMISTSEIKISVVIEEKYLELAVRALHSSFNLDKEPTAGGLLQGIKGQYLIFADGVINMRKYTGYQVEVSVK